MNRILFSRLQASGCLINTMLFDGRGGWFCCNVKESDCYVDKLAALGFKIVAVTAAKEGQS